MFMVWLGPVLAIVLVAGLIGASCDSSGGCSRDDFDVEAWRDVDERHELAEKLVECETLNGASRQEVRSLLGQSQFSMPSDRHYQYLIGPEETPFVPETDYLIIEFDKGGSVSSTAIRTGG